ncbi:membrane protein insertion efficiency factor YidD [Methylotuvimicrobium sp. KM2]|uniref:membrane protein insertion efficiency factor YidD n=1 Tax=Methylotuvimicrobium sp. KM2 TaxID=3133976 RepID=UPI0031013549
MLTKGLQSLLLGIVRFYRLVISPLLPPSCRYQPTCSEYAIEAITRHGPFKGLWLTLKRLGRCQPWGGHGYDPVPPKEPDTTNKS